MRAAASRLRGHFVLLRAGGLRLLLPQGEVGAAECVEEPPRASEHPGVFLCGQGEREREVIALSAALQPLAQFPAERFLLAQLDTVSGGPFFAWDEVRVLIDGEFDVQPLPPVLRVDGLPVDGLVEHEDGLAFHTSAARVLAYAALAQE